MSDPSTSNYTSTRIGMTRKRRWYWLLVSAVAVAVYVSGLAFSLALGPALQGSGLLNSPACSVANFWPDSMTRTPTAPLSQTPPTRP
jgi:hypothetical protein